MKKFSYFIRCYSLIQQEALKFQELFFSYLIDIFHKGIVFDNNNIYLFNVKNIRWRRKGKNK